MGVPSPLETYWLPVCRILAFENGLGPEIWQFLGFMSALIILILDISKYMKVYEGIWGYLGMMKVYEVDGGYHSLSLLALAPSVLSLSPPSPSLFSLSSLSSPPLSLTSRFRSLSSFLFSLSRILINRKYLRMLVIIWKYFDDI